MRLSGLQRERMLLGLARELRLRERRKNRRRRRRKKATERPLPPTPGSEFSPTATPGL